MPGLWISLGILLFLALLLLARGSVTLSYRSPTDFRLVIRALGIPVFRFPKPARKVRIRDYSDAARARRARREQKKAARRKKDKKAVQKPKNTRKHIWNILPGDESNLSEFIHMATDLVSLLLSRLSRHLRIRVARARIIIATEDAAGTALLYGTVSQSVAVLFGLLSEHANIHYGFHPDVSVDADFGATRTQADVCLTLSIGVWQVLDILVRLFLRYRKINQHSK